MFLMSLMLTCFIYIYRFKKKNRPSIEEFENGGGIFGGDEDRDDDNESDFEDEDERPDSVDDKARKKEMRKGMDLATTLERIEKNFVITDPRLPDNPIVSLLSFCTNIFI